MERMRGFITRRRLTAVIAVVAAGLTCAALPATVGAAGKVKKHGRMTGGGSVFTSTFRVTHGFQVRCNAADPRQNLEVNWDSGNRFHMTELTSATCFDSPNISEGQPRAGFDTYQGRGIGRYNGQPGARVKFEFTDAGEPGVNDTAYIRVRDAAGNTVLEVFGRLTFGNHQAHLATGGGP